MFKHTRINDLLFTIEDGWIFVRYTFEDHSGNKVDFGKQMSVEKPIPPYALFEFFEQCQLEINLRKFGPIHTIIENLKAND